MNIELRSWTMADLQDLIRLCNEADRTYLSGRMPYPYTESDGRWWLNMVSEHEGKDGIFRRICAAGRTVGNISVERKGDVFCRDGELGYVLDQAYWSKGIMSEAVRRIVPLAMETLDLLRISAQVYAPNIASCRVLEHNGFKREGLIPQAVWKDGQIYDLCLYGILLSVKND